MLDRATLQNLYRYGCSLTHDEDTAYDLLQDAIEISLRKAPDDVATLAGYVQRIMRNRFIDQYRREKRHPTISLDDNDNSLINIDQNVLEDIVIAEHEVDAILEQLEPVERELLFLWALEGCTALEIAERTETPRGTVLSRIHRLKKKIIRHSSSHDPEANGGAGQ